MLEVEDVIDITISPLFEKAMDLASDEHGFLIESVLIKGVTPEGQEFDLEFTSEYCDCDGDCDCCIDEEAE